MYLVAYCLGLSCLLMATVSIYFHRGLAHRSVLLCSPLVLLFRTANWLFLGTDEQRWVAAHRLHHRYTNEPGDPHNPNTSGFLMVFFRTGPLIRKATGDAKVVNRVARDVDGRPLLGHRYAGLPIGYLVPLAVGGTPLFGATIVSALSILFAVGAVNAACHWRVPDGEKVRNIRLLAPLTFGETLHLNHHKRPTSPSYRQRTTDLDVGYLLIWSLVRLRLATYATVTNHDY